MKMLDLSQLIGIEIIPLFVVPLLASMKLSFILLASLLVFTCHDPKCSAFRVSVAAINRKPLLS